MSVLLSRKGAAQPIARSGLSRVASAGLAVGRSVSSAGRSVRRSKMLARVRSSAAELARALVVEALGAAAPLGAATPPPARGASAVDLASAP